MYVQRYRLKDAYWNSQYSKEWKTFAENVQRNNFWHIFSPQKVVMVIIKPQMWYDIEFTPPQL